ncbi:amidohydrolase family protein [Micromonospora sp. SCSIO 07396]
MDIIDTHLHLPTPWRAWTYGPPSLLDLQTELLLGQIDAAGVDAAVLISAPGIAPAESCEAAAAAHPDRLAAVLTLDETAPDITDQVAWARHRTGVVGLRISTLFSPQHAARLRDGGYDDLLKAAGEHDLSVCYLGSGGDSLDDLAGTARAHPATTLIVDHLGLNQPPYLPVTDPPWRDLDRLLALAGLPNVLVKLSGVPTLSAEPYPYADVWPFLGRVLDAFGVDRCLWGTDQHRVAGRLPGLAPVPDHPRQHSYAEGLHFLRDTTRLSATDKVALLGGTARRVMGWPAPRTLRRTTAASRRADRTVARHPPRQPRSPATPQWTTAHPSPPGYRGTNCPGGVPPRPIASTATRPAR